jgi:hypothetical protein
VVNELANLVVVVVVVVVLVVVVVVDGLSLLRAIRVGELLGHRVDLFVHVDEGIRALVVPAESWTDPRPQARA